MRMEPTDVEGLRPLLRELAVELVSELLSRQLPHENSGNNKAVPRLAYSEAEAAAMLGVETHVLREQRKLGRIEFCRGPGRRILYTRQQVEAYLRRHV